MTLHGNALTSDEAAQLSAIRNLYELEGRTGGGIALRPTWGAVGQLLCWHDRLASLLAAHEAERRCVLRALGDDYAGEFEIPREKQRPLDSMVMEAMSQYENRIAEREAEIDRLRAELLKTPPTLEWLRALLGPEDNPVGEMTRWRKHDLVFVNGLVRHEWTDWLYRTRADVLAAVKESQ